MRSHRHWHGRPPWWPEGESWPPANGRAREYWISRRRRVGRRIGGVAFVIALLMFAGMASVTRFIARSAGFDLPFWGAALLFLPILVVIGRTFAMRGLGSSVGDIVTAADQVAAGDFTVRVREAGPPFIRSVSGAFNTMTSKLQEQDEQRRQLMADVAHELRTPLTVMQGRLEGMLDGIYPSDPGNVRQVLDGTRTLARLVEDLRTLANADAGALVLHREPVDVGALATHVAASFGPLSDEQHIAIRVNVSAGIPSANVDPARIGEVLTNLVANALQHTPAGGRVTIDVERAAAAIVVRVTDTGRGIAPADLPKIFDRFYKGPDSRGSGLGLAIARKLVLAHGGEIVAASTPGSGTTMTVTMTSL